MPKISLLKFFCPPSMVEPSTALWCSTQLTALPSPTYNVMLPPAAPMSLSPGSMASSELCLHFGQVGDPRKDRGRGGLGLSCRSCSCSEPVDQAEHSPHSLCRSVLYQLALLPSFLLVYSRGVCRMGLPREFLLWVGHS